MRHYLGPDAYDLRRYDGTPLLIGCTTGNSIPSANSRSDAFDFWIVESYNLFSAQMRRPAAPGGAWACDAFLVDSLPPTTSGLCGRDCKNAHCTTVVPPCNSSIYEVHLNDAAAVVGAAPSAAYRNAELMHEQNKDLTLRSLLLPVPHAKSAPTTTLCTTSWRASILKHYQVAYYAARTLNGSSVAEAKAAAQAELSRVFAKTTVMFSLETRRGSAADAPTCIYPNQGDCGVPRAFGTWSQEAFAAVMPQFRTLSTAVATDDNETDVVDFAVLPPDNFGAYQFSFLPTAWVSNASLAC